MMKLTVLDNGLRVVSREMPGLETASVGLFARCGLQRVRWLLTAGGIIAIHVGEVA